MQQCASSNRYTGVANRPKTAPKTTLRKPARQCFPSRHSTVAHGHSKWFSQITEAWDSLVSALAPSRKTPESSRNLKNTKRTAGSLPQKAATPNTRRTAGRPPLPQKTATPPRKASKLNQGFAKATRTKRASTTVSKNTTTNNTDWYIDTSSNYSFGPTDNGNNWFSDAINNCRSFFDSNSSGTNEQNRRNESTNNDSFSWFNSSSSSRAHDSNSWFSSSSNWWGDVFSSDSGGSGGGIFGGDGGDSGGDSGGNGGD